MTRPTVRACVICDAPTAERRTCLDDGIVVVSWRCACGSVEHIRLSLSAAEALPPAASAHGLVDRALRLQTARA